LWYVCFLANAIPEIAWLLMAASDMDEFLRLLPVSTEKPIPCGEKYLATQLIGFCRKNEKIVNLY
jgi:hypothetical protein